MGEVIMLPVVRIGPDPSTGGNGAREAVLDVFRECACDEPEDPAAIESADVFLLELAIRGFKVVPIDG